MPRCIYMYARTIRSRARRSSQNPPILVSSVASRMGGFCLDLRYIWPVTVNPRRLCGTAGFSLSFIRNFFLVLWLSLSVHTMLLLMSVIFWTCTHLAPFPFVFFLGFFLGGDGVVCNLLAISFPLCSVYPPLASLSLIQHHSIVPAITLSCHLCPIYDLVALQCSRTDMLEWPPNQLGE